MKKLASKSKAVHIEEKRFNQKRQKEKVYAQPTTSDDEKLEESPLPPLPNERNERDKKKLVITSFFLWTPIKKVIDLA